MSTKTDMELRASGEDYLETVLILGQRKSQVRAIDVAQYLGYAKTSVSHGLRLLRQGGFLSRDADGYLYLTEAGRDMAERIYAKHRFFAGWLIRAGVAPDIAEKDACRMEHAISEESFQSLMQALGHETSTNVKYIFRLLQPLRGMQNGAVPNGGDSSETTSVLGMVRRLLYGYGDVHRVQT